MRKREREREGERERERERFSSSGSRRVLASLRSCVCCVAAECRVDREASIDLNLVVHGTDRDPAYERSASIGALAVTPTISFRFHPIGSHFRAPSSSRLLYRQHSVSTSHSQCSNGRELYVVVYKLINRIIIINVVIILSF